MNNVWWDYLVTTACHFERIPSPEMGALAEIAAVRLKVTAVESARRFEAIEERWSRPRSR